MGFDIHALAVVLEHDIPAGVQLVDREYAQGSEHIDVFLIQKVRHTVGCRPIVQKTAYLGRLLDPGVIISVAVEDDPLVVTDRLLDHFMKRVLEILSLLQPVGINSETLRDGAVQHDVGACDAVRGAEHAELELVPGECKRRSPVPVRRIPVEPGQNIDAQLHLDFLRAFIRRIGIDGFENGIQLIAEENGDDCRRGFICTETVVVARCGDGQTKQILIIVNGLDDGAEEEQELGILVRCGARREQVLAAVGRNGPVVVLAASVHAGKGLFVKQAYKSVSCRDFLHDLHGQLIVIRRDIRRCINRSELMLRRSYFVVFCLSKDAELPELIIQIFHKGGDPRFDHTEIMVVELLALGRLRAEQCAAGVLEVRALLVQFGGDQEIFLLGTDGGDDPFRRIIAEKAQNSEGLFIQDLHGPEQRGLLIQCMPAVGAECGGDAECPAFDEGVGCRIPGCVSSGFEGGAESARREGGGIGFSLDQFLAGEFHDDAAVRGRADKAVVLLSGDAGQWLEPVRKMCCTVIDGPVFHRLGDGVGHADIEPASLVDRFSERSVDIRGEGGTHDTVIEDHTSEIFRYCIHDHFSFSFKK